MHLGNAVLREALDRGGSLTSCSLSAFLLWDRTRKAKVNLGRLTLLVNTQRKRSCGGNCLGNFLWLHELPKSLWYQRKQRWGCLYRWALDQVGEQGLKSDQHPVYRFRCSSWGGQLLSDSHAVGSQRPSLNPRVCSRLEKTLKKKKEKLHKVL